MAPQKTFIPLENNPAVMTRLAHQLGLSPDLVFHDLYSLTDETLIALIPRPAAALLFVYPESAQSSAYHDTEKATDAAYTGSGPQEPVMWYPQTVRNACGLMGLLHCVTNAPASAHIARGTPIDEFRAAAVPLKSAERAALIETSATLEALHASAAQEGDTVAPPLGEDPGHAFIAFVRGSDGHLYELDGSRGGPVDRGVLEDGDDVLSPRALELGPLPYLRREQRWSGSPAFSATVLAAKDY